MATNEQPYPIGSPRVTCPCGETFNMWWNGGELDEHTCSCGRKYWGEHRGTVMIVQDPPSTADKEN